MIVRVQIPGTGVVRPERDHGAERQVARHGCIVERVADECGLKVRAEVSVAVPTENIEDKCYVYRGKTLSSSITFCTAQ